MIIAYGFGFVDAPDKDREYTLLQGGNKTYCRDSLEQVIAALPNKKNFNKKIILFIKELMDDSQGKYNINKSEKFNIDNELIIKHVLQRIHKRFDVSDVLYYKKELKQINDHPTWDEIIKSIEKQKQQEKSKEIELNNKIKLLEEKININHANNSINNMYLSLNENTVKELKQAIDKIKKGPYGCMPDFGVTLEEINKFNKLPDILSTTNAIRTKGRKRKNKIKSNDEKPPHKKHKKK